MAHDVQFSVPARALGRADIEFRVRKNRKLSGTLTVSNGSIVWFPSHAQWGYKMRWERFSKLMEEHATRYEKR